MIQLNRQFKNQNMILRFLLSRMRHYRGDEEYLALCVKLGMVLDMPTYPFT